MIQRLTCSFLPQLGFQAEVEVEWLIKSISLIDLLVGKVIISKNIKAIVIIVPYYIIDGSVSNNLINILGIQLSELFKCPVEIQIVRLSAPYLDASILAQWLTKDLIQATFSETISTLITIVGPSVYNSIPGAITGIKIKLSGRLITEPSQPRTVVQSASLGSFRSSLSQSLQSSSHTVTNAKGVYTIKVWLSVQA